MTSGNFSLVPVDSITINREERQRKTIENIEELADSIRKLGLINPITITSQNVLVAGERRLTAHKFLGFDTIAVQYVEDLNNEQLQLIELDENIKRQNLSWEEESLAIAEFERLSRTVDPEITQEQISKNLGMSSANFRRYVDVANSLKLPDSPLKGMTRFSQAVNFVERAKTRAKEAVLSDPAELLNSVKNPAPLEGTIKIPEFNPETKLPELKPEPAPASSIIDYEIANFKSYFHSPLEDPFNFIHVDFPYGANTGNKKSGQINNEGFGTDYSDKPEDYFDLLEFFCSEIDMFCAPSAHLMFWFSMDYYHLTLEALSASGWTMNPFPLIWSKSNIGILPDPNRGPRRVYETALFGYRGGRQVVRATRNHFNKEPNKTIHANEKPPEMLEHFFKMIVDENTRLFDPTAGSGNALSVAANLGAEYCLGLEISPEHGKAAQEKLGLI